MDRRARSESHHSNTNSGVCLAHVDGSAAEVLAKDIKVMSASKAVIRLDIHRSVKIGDDALNISYPGLKPQSHCAESRCVVRCSRQTRGSINLRLPSQPRLRLSTGIPCVPQSTTDITRAE